MPEIPENNTCRYCKKTFKRESSIIAHACERKNRHNEKNERGVQLGFNTYIKFYEHAQGSAKLKSFTDFAESPYYKGFVKFGRHCVSINAININRYITFVIRQNKKLVHWTDDAVYTEYLADLLHTENAVDALARAIENGIQWETQNTPAKSEDMLRYGNSNVLCYMIVSGKISAWVLYNCSTGKQFLNKLNPEQLNIIWDYINPDFWQQQFTKYKSDQLYITEMLVRAGW